MIKGVQNLDTVACKLRHALTKASNYRLDVAKERTQKREKIVEKWKTKAIAIKRHRDRGGISLSSKKKENYKSNIKDNTDSDQTYDEYSIQY